MAFFSSILGSSSETLYEILKISLYLFVAGYTIYSIVLVIYRLTLHPLAKFPGPFLCRISWCYEIYYEAILGGKLLERLPALHEKYGPAIRISPREIHVNDPQLYHLIYKQNTTYLKDPYAYKLGAPNALSMTLDPLKHKRRRELLNPSFSKRRVNMLEHIMYDEIEKIFSRMTTLANKGDIIPIQEAYYCYTADVISQYLFGKSLNMIEEPNFATEKIKELRSFSSNIWISIHFDLIRMMIVSMPRWLAAKVASGWMKIIWFCETLASEALEEFTANHGKEKELREETVYDRMLTSNLHIGKTGKPPIGHADLSEEGASLLVAGTETSATTLAYATYYILAHPEVERRVLEDLATVERDENGRLPLVKVEALPYLVGVMKETLRFTHGVPGRLTRIVPRGGLYIPAIADYVPEGSIVGISHIFIHDSPEIFEEPKKFKPERWMGAKGKELDHWLLAFSKGSRDCIGKNLALAEMILMVANIFTRFDMKLLPNADDDMVIIDRVIVHPKRNLRIAATVKPHF